MILLMKRLVVFLFVAHVLCLLSSCVRHYDGHMKFVLVNKSGRTIGCQDKGFRASDASDTLIQWGMRFVKPDSSLAYELTWNSWEEEFDGYSYYQLLIVDGDAYEKVYKNEPLDSIRKKVPVLHVYQLTQSDLEKMNWTVIYPPVGDLKDKIVSPDHRNK